jgi:peroxiredoxin family protein
MNEPDSHSIKKVNIICSKGTSEDVYAALILGNGAVMEGIECNLFFTFYGIDALMKERSDDLHSATVGNPALRISKRMRLPSILGMLPGIEALITKQVKKEMERIDVPPVSEFLELISAGGGKIYACRLAIDMFKIRKEDLSELVSDIITVGDFYALAGGKGSQIIFI